jgi:hypothetical protein
MNLLLSAGVVAYLRDLPGRGWEALYQGLIYTVHNPSFEDAGPSEEAGTQTQTSKKSNRPSPEPNIKTGPSWPAMF